MWIVEGIGLLLITISLACLAIVIVFAFFHWLDSELSFFGLTLGVAGLMAGTSLSLVSADEPRSIVCAILGLAGLAIILLEFFKSKNGSHNGTLIVIGIALLFASMGGLVAWVGMIIAPSLAFIVLRSGGD